MKCRVCLQVFRGIFGLLCFFQGGNVLFCRYLSLLFQFGSLWNFCRWQGVAVNILWIVVSLPGFS